jgi:hypothetical protein
MQKRRRIMIFSKLFNKKVKDSTEIPLIEPKSYKAKEKIAERKGELGEYKIDIQLDQLPKEYKYLSDLLIENPKAKSGYSQIDHIVISPYGIFVIETKNYEGTIYGDKERKTWLVNGKFKMMNPFVQNYGHIEAVKRLIDKKYENLFISMVSFTKRCTFKVGTEYRKIASNELIVYDIELSEFINRKVAVIKLQNSLPLLAEQDVLTIHKALLAANLTDPKIREKHITGLKQGEKQEVPKQTGDDQATCTVCNKVVSQKVKEYCLSNKKFNGKVYCFDHQKTLM